MAESQFIPGAGAGNISGALNAGLATGSSMMERAQQTRINDQKMQIAQADEQRRSIEATILRPSLIAKANADIAEAGAQVRGLEQTENARSAAAGIIPQARGDFDSLMQLADPDAREQAGLDWIASYGHLENVAAYQKEFAAKKDVVASIHKEASTLRQLNVKIQGDKDVAKIHADTSVATAQIRADVPDKIARYQQSLAEARASGDDEAATLYTNLLQKAQASPINTAYGSEQMQQKLEAAKAAGDVEETTFWEKRIKALTERGVKKGTGINDPRAAQFFGGAVPASTPVPGAVPQSKAPASGKPVDPFAKIKL